MSKRNETKDLVAVVQETGGKLMTLDALRKELKEVPTLKLVTGYLLVKDYSNTVKKFTDAVREELLYANEESIAEKRYDGRLFSEDDVSIDEKGHRRITGEGGKILKAEKRVSISLDEEKAEVVLKEKGLWEQATDSVVVSTDVSVLEDLKALYESMEEQVVTGNKDPMLKLKDYMDALEKAIQKFTVKNKLNDKKLEALVVLDALSLEEAEAFSEESIVYALKEEKPKK